MNAVIASSLNRSERSRESTLPPPDPMQYFGCQDPDFKEIKPESRISSEQQTIKRWEEGDEFLDESGRSPQSLSRIAECVAYIQLTSFGLVPGRASNKSRRRRYRKAEIEACVGPSKPCRPEI